MFLRAYRRPDKRALQLLYYDTVHGVTHPDVTAADLERWAPAMPDRDRWMRLDEQTCFVVELHKKLVGFAGFTDDGVLEWLYVDPAHQGKGIAKALVRQVVRTARKFNMPALRVVAPINARAFFESMGFTGCGPDVEPADFPPQGVWFCKNLTETQGATPGV